MKSAINEIGNRLDAMNSRLEEAEEWISDLDDKVMESEESKPKRERRIMQHKNIPRQLSDSIKSNNICIIGVSEEKEKRGKKIYLKK